jgi:hypothetical protein
VRQALGLTLLAAAALLVAVFTAAASPGQARAAQYGRSSSNETVLSVRGDTLQWTRVAGASRYVIAMLTGRHATAYRVVKGVRFTPQRLPRQTVRYRVRANVRRAPWSRVVTIAYRQMNTTLQLASGQTSLAGTSAAAAVAGAPAASTLTASQQPTSQAPSSAQPTSPAQPPASSAGQLKVGVMDLGNYNYAPFYSASLFRSLGVTYTREDVDRGEYTGTCTWQDYVCTALQNGITPLVLFEGYADSNMTSEIVALAQNLNKLAAIYPIMNNMHVIEFGNEVYWGTSGPAENATTYGQQYNAAHAALAAAGLGSWKLLADGDGLGTCVNSYTSPDWINQVIAAQSDGAAGIDGWTVHPYGPMTTDFGCGEPGQGFGWPTVVDYHNIAVAAGSDAPWYVTEVGQCLGGAGCNDPVPMGSATDMPQSAGSAPYYTQAADVRQYLTDAGGDVRTGTPALYPWIAAIIFYQAYDDSSGWFGLASNGENLDQPVNFQRPALTELAQWIAANGEG